MVIPLALVLSAAPQIVTGASNLIKSIGGNTNHEKREKAREVISEEIKKEKIEPKESVVNLIVEIGVLVGKYGAKLELEENKIIIDLG